jgi:transketolase N-terminal domain/subunit
MRVGFMRANLGNGLKLGRHFRIDVRGLAILLCAMWSLATPLQAAAPATILVMGDSLSAGYGIKVENGWVALLAKRLAAQGSEYRVVNASVSGETSSGANWAPMMVCAACQMRNYAAT